MESYPPNSSDKSEKLAPFKYDTFHVGSIKASGWLRNQLQLCADGLGGHMYDFYRYIQRSSWLGGDWEYSPLNEAAPYWFNYIVPLAWTLDDARLKAQAKSFLDYVLEAQAEDGWLGPETTKATRGIWARSLLCFGLVQYAEAEPAETERIVTAMHRFTILVHAMLERDFEGLIQQPGDVFDRGGFGNARTHELVMSLQWLYESHPRDNSHTIWKTMELMFEGGRKSHGDWTAFFTTEAFPKLGTPDIKTNIFTHGVNLIEGLRYPSLLHRMTQEEFLADQTRNAVDMTYKYHSSRSGTVIADEHLGGLSAQRGSETCMSVEMIYSMAWLHRYQGFNDYADKAEAAAFNALPAAISPDWWSHTYVIQTNQPWSKKLDKSPFNDVNEYGNTYSLEPDYPCCTVNHPQAYPKYVTSSYVFDKKGGIVHALLGPTNLTTSISGKPVEIICTTNYPFSGLLKYSITTPTDLTFSIRIPDWTFLDKSTFSLADSPPSPIHPTPAGLHTLHIPGSPTLTSLTLQLAAIPRIVPRNGTVSIYRGALLFALSPAYTSTPRPALDWKTFQPLPISETTTQTFDHDLSPTSLWKYAIDPSTLEAEDAWCDGDEILASPVWSREKTPCVMWVDAWEIEWPVEGEEGSGVVGETPVGKAVRVVGERTRVRLVPYGAAKLHVAEFPVVDGRDLT
ncbi:hypothetical protein K402DRAFT_425448 [Aulographum hederae CBS 113979]|uniref:Non-reducing end beta-L-arabinofuranosidase-like GH127 catalytic domain-containing protein n=1 Tax=Aulographum hederae CBS 113979 TaxID=1176131 RepID=A0A6G1GKW2_9PEZI|nr:hypothetical protein K402DRAFT_425448 [Aulographum hederae CBS 113979]